MEHGGRRGGACIPSELTGIAQKKKRGDLPPPPYLISLMLSSLHMISCSSAMLSPLSTETSRGNGPENTKKREGEIRYNRDNVASPAGLRGARIAEERARPLGSSSSGLHKEPGSRQPRGLQAPPCSARGSPAVFRQPSPAFVTANYVKGASECGGTRRGAPGAMSLTCAVLGSTDAFARVPRERNGITHVSVNMCHILHVYVNNIFACTFIHTLCLH